MKKDSFTFSDKLKKSKTLPLSKRIPSRIGGEVKAKRTLFERAQRDLPFIIVAALALLLLPFLSRESVDDIPSVVWPQGEEEIDITQKPISQTESDSTFAGFSDPLKWISTASGRDSMRNAIDTPSEYDADASGSSSGSSAGSYYGSQKEEDYYSSSKTPATGKYGKTVRRSIRNSINRVPTQIGSLRASSLPGARTGQGVTHTLANGAKAKGPTGQSNLSGVRPVALQPLSAKGGRDLTGGDALYAEAARSIGAFNKPGAKQALLEAQLKDVDGQPLGETKEGPGADPFRPGQTGNLANNWNHTPLKPWWWDMMNDRAQKRWMLWHYNWEEMLSKNLINWTSGLMSCLAVGSADGKVDKFLGADGSDPDGKCVDAAGNEVYIRRRQYIKELKVQGGKEGSGAAVSALPWEEACVKYGHGIVQFKPGSDHKSFWDVRFECLGLDLGAIKEKTQLQHKRFCSGMYSDPMYITIEAERNGKAKVNKVKNMGYYVVNSNGCVVDLQKAKYGRNEIDYNALVKNVHLPKINEQGQVDWSNAKDVEIYRPAKIVVYRVGSYTMLEDNYLDTDDVYVDGKKYLENFSLAKAKIDSPKTTCLTEDQLKEILKPIGKWRTEDNAKRYLNELATCPVPSNRFIGTKVSPVRINPDESTASFDGMTCNDRVVYIDQSNTTHAISATIKNPGPRTVAVVLEYVQGGATVSEDYVAGKIPERTGYLVKEVIDFSKENSWRTRSVTKTDEHGKSYEETSYAADFVVGLSSTIKDDTGALEDAQSGSNLPGARAGRGYVIWITTDDTNAELVRRNAFVTDKSDINALLKLSKEKGYKSAMCEYRWGCESSNCSANNLDNYFCYDDDGDSVNGPFYQAMKVKNYTLKRYPGTTVDKSRLTSNPVRCDPLCVFLDGSYGVLPSKNEPFDPIPGVKLTPDDVSGAFIDPDCPHCNEVNPEPKKKTGRICYELVNGEQIPYPCIEIPDSKVPGKNPLYIRSEVDPVDPEDEMDEITPICYKKAIALGHIYVREPDGTGKVKVQPDEDIVRMLKEKTPAEQEKLCPYCHGQDEEKPVPEEVKKKCTILLDGKTFVHPWYHKYAKVPNLDEIAINIRECYLAGVKEFIFEGHASRTGDANGNRYLSYDRALKIADDVKNNRNLNGYKIKLDGSNRPDGEYPPHSPGGWPDNRNSTPIQPVVDPDITFILEGKGACSTPERNISGGADCYECYECYDRANHPGRTKEEHKKYEEKDRYFIIYPKE